MPVVNTRMPEGHPQARKDTIARRVTTAIGEVAVSALGKRTAA